MNAPEWLIRQTAPCSPVKYWGFSSSAQPWILTAEAHLSYWRLSLMHRTSILLQFSESKNLKIWNLRNESAALFSCGLEKCLIKVIPSSAPLVSCVRDKTLSEWLCIIPMFINGRKHFPKFCLFLNRKNHTIKKIKNNYDNSSGKIRQNIIEIVLFFPTLNSVSFLSSLFKNGSVLFAVGKQ